MSQPFLEITGPEGRPLACLALYPTRSAAYDRALVIAAMQVPHWVLRQPAGLFALCVEPGHAPRAAGELARFEAERPAPAGHSPPAPAIPHSLLSLWVCGWFMAACFALQFHGPAHWEERGLADADAMLRGQWWRAFTALTLHADLAHLAANLVIGLLYAFFLLPLFGTGWTWLLILLSGALGNELNAWGHRGEHHLSLGASTAVFGALGLLVGAQCARRALAVRHIPWREFLLPVGAGLGLLAFLGVGDRETDYTAHLFGLLSGLPFGALALLLRAGRRTPRSLQLALAWAAPALLTFAWWRALHSS